MRLLNLDRTHGLAACLVVLMAATRFHHEGTAFAVPDASLAVFFLGGWYLRSVPAFAGYLLAAFAVDFLAIHYGGVSDYCISPAYGFLVPTYGVLWWAGRRAGIRADSTVPGMGRTVTALLIASTAAFVISNGSFFLLSGKVGGATGWVDYGRGVAAYYPGYLVSTFFYCGLVFVVKALTRVKWLAEAWLLHLK